MLLIVDNYDENQYNLLQFEFTADTLSGIPVNWGYSTMTLGTVKIMGLFDNVKHIYINNQTHKNFKYYPDDKVRMNFVHSKIFDCIREIYTSLFFVRRNLLSNRRILIYRNHSLFSGSEKFKFNLVM